MTIDLRQGRWQDALADVSEVDALIVDAPYSARTHAGHDGGTAGIQASALKGGGYVRSNGNLDAPYDRKSLGYVGLDDESVGEAVDFWHPRCKGWFVTITDDVLAPVWRDALRAAGRYVFAPIPWVAPGSRVRLAGDGPSSWTCWIIVARPRHEPYSKWGTLPGAYIITTDRGTASPITGTKPLALMQALVRDYSRPGDLVCDPCAGTGTTLLAARNLGRSAIGSEMDPKTYAYAKARLDPIAPTVALGSDVPQSDLFG